MKSVNVLMVLVKNILEKSKPLGSCLYSRGILFFVAIIFAAFFSIKTASAAIAPPYITYQGRLYVGSSPATTTQNIIFTMYDSSSGGTALYTAGGTLISPTAISVLPVNGLFTVYLGDTGTNALDPSIFQNNSNIYLEVTINGETLNPRKRIISAPFAFNAKYLDGVAATSTPTSSRYIPVSDAVGNFWFNQISSTGFSTNNYLNLASGTLSVSNPNPVVVGTASNVTDTVSVFISGKYAYTANFASDTISIIDISNPTSPNVISALGGFGGPAAIAVAGKYAYVPNNNSHTLSVVDVSNASAPQIVGNTTNTLFGAFKVTVSGKYAYVARGSNDTISIVDISNPINPIVVSTLSGFGYAREIYVSGKYAYVARGLHNRLSVVDVSDPYNPFIVGTTFGLGNPYSVYVSGRYAYTANFGSSSMSVVDISNPAAPVVVGTVAGLGTPYSIVVAGKYAYTANFASDTMSVVDISNPAAPVVVRSTPGLSGPWSLKISGKYAYVANRTSGTLSVIDLNGADISSARIGNIESNGINVTENLNVGNNAFIKNSLNVGEGGVYTDGGINAAGNSTLATGPTSSVGIGTNSPQAKLHLYNGSLVVDNPVNMKIAGFVTDTLRMNRTVGVEVVGKYAYILSLNLSSLAVVDVSNPAVPTVVGFVSDTLKMQTPNGFHVVGKYAYVSNLNGLTIVDVSNPRAPTTTATLTSTSMAPFDIYVSGKYAYLASFGSPFNVTAIDISDPYNPKIVGSSPTISNLSSIFVSGKYAYVTGRVANKYYILDISNPANMFVVGSTTHATYLSGANRSYVSGKNAYVINRQNASMAIIDVSDPVNPTTTGFITDPRMAVPYGISVAGKYAYVGSNASSSVVAIDISSSTAPFVVGASPSSTDATGEIYDLKVVGRYAYTASRGPSGIGIIDLMGADISNADVGNLSAGQLKIFDNAEIGTDLDVRNALRVGGSLLTDGGLSVMGRSQLSTTTIGRTPSSTDETLDILGSFAVESSSSTDIFLVNGTGIFSFVTSTLATTTISSLNFTSATGTNLNLAGLFSFTNANGASISSTNIFGTNANFISLTSTYVYTPGLSFFSANGNSVTSTNIFTSQFRSQSASSTNLFSNNFSAGLLDVNEGHFNSLTTTDLGVTGITRTYGTTTLATGNGFVGIGTLTPTRMLEIVNTQSIPFEPGTSTIAILLRNTASGALPSRQTDIIFAGSDVSPTGNYAAITGVVTGSGPAGQVGDLVFSTKSLIGDVTLSERLRIDYLGNVGIGTSTPIATLHVNGTFLVNGTSTLATTSISSLTAGAVTSTNIFNSDRLVVQGTSTLATTSIRQLTVGTSTITTSSVGVRIIDGTLLVSDPVNPVLKGYTSNPTTMDNPDNVYVSGHYAYVVSSLSNTLTIIDVTNPAAPTTTGFTTSSILNGGSKDIRVAGKYAYVTSNGNSTLSIIDISNVSAPTTTGFLTDATRLNQPTSLYISGKYAYVTVSGANDALAIIDISNPKNPTIVGSVVNAVTLNGASDVYVQGDYAYVSAGTADGIIIINIANPQAPFITGSILDNFYFDTATDVYVSGRYAYVAAGGTGSRSITSVDISNPTNPQVVGQTSPSFFGTLAMHVSGKYAYLVRSGANGLSIIDISNPNNLQIIGSITDTTYMSAVSGVYVSGKYAYVLSAAASDGLAVIDLKGADISTAVVSSLEASDVAVINNVDIGNDLYVKRGLSVGPGGIFSQGPVSIASSSSSTLPLLSLFGGGVQIQDMFATTSLTTSSLIIGGTSSNLQGTYFVNSLGSSVSGTLRIFGTSTFATTSITSLTVSSGTSTNFFSTGLSYISASGTNLTTTNAYIANLVVGNCSGCAGGGGGGAVNTSTANYFAYYFNNTSVTGTPLMIISGNTIAISGGLNVTGDASFVTTTITTSTITSLNFGSATGTNLFAANINSQNAVFGNVTATNFYASNIPYVITGSATGTNLFATNSTFVGVTTTNISFVRANGTSLTTTNFNNTGAMTFLSATGTTLNLLGLFSYTSASGTSMTSTFIYTPGLSFVNASGTSMTSTNLFASLFNTTNLVSTNALFTNLTTTNAFVSGPLVVSGTSTLATATIQSIRGNYNNGDILYATNSTLTALPIGVSNQFLTVSANGVPTWSTVALNGSLNYFFYSQLSAGTTTAYRQVTSPTTTRIVSSFGGVGTGNNFLRNWVTDSGVPNLSFMPAGTYSVMLHGARTAGTKNIQLFAEVWEVTATGTDFALIGTTELSPILTGGELEYNLNFVNANVYNFASTSSRIKTKVIAVGQAGGTNATVEIYQGGTSDSHTSLPSNSVDATNFIPYVGATQNVNLASNSLFANQLIISGTSTLGTTTIGRPGLTTDETLDVLGSFAVESSLSNDIFLVNNSGMFVTVTTSLATTTISSSTILSLNFISATGTSLNLAGLLTFTSASGTTMTSTNAFVNGLTFVSATGTSMNLSGLLSFASASGTNLTSTNIVAGRLIYGSATGTSLTSTNVSVGNMFNVSGTSTLLGNVGVGTTSPQSKIHVYDGTLLVDSPVSMPFAGFTASDLLLQNAYSVDVSGKYAYVAAYGSKGLAIVDISNPQAPTTTGFTTNSVFFANATSIKVSGKYAYVGNTNAKSIAVVDVSNPALPTTTGFTTLNLQYFVNDIDVQGKYLYVASSGTVAVVDISNPYAPTTTALMSDLTRLNDPRGINVIGRYAYIPSYYGNSVTIVDISNPYAPTTTGYTSHASKLGGLNGIYVSGKYAYVVANTSRNVAIVDISNPYAPTTTGFVNDSTALNGVNSIVVAGKYAYLTTGGGFVSVDVSSSTAPFVVNRVFGALLNSPNDTVVSGKYAYVVNFSGNSLTVMDLGGANISTANIGSIATNELTVYENADVGSLNIRSGLGVGAGGIFTSGGLAVYGTSTLATTTISNLVVSNCTGCGSGASLSANNTWTGLNNFTLTTTFATTTFSKNVGIGTTTPRATLEVNGNKPVSSNSSFIDDNAEVFALYNNGTKIMNAGINLSSDPLVEIFGGLAVGGIAGNFGAANDLYLKPGATSGVVSILNSNGDTGLLTVTNDGFVGIGTTTPSAKLHVFDGTLLVDSPVNPKHISSMSSGCGGNGSVSVSGKYAYQICGDGLGIYEISDPSYPSFISLSQSSYWNSDGIAVAGKYAYVTNRSLNGLAVIDISNPYAPTTTGFTSSSALQGSAYLYVSGKYAYVGSHNAGFAIVDISNPFAPTTTASLPGIVSHHVYVSGRYAYITGAWQDSIHIVDIENPYNPVLKATLTDSSNLKNVDGLYVSGKSAYVTVPDKNAVAIINISSSTAPVLTGFTSSTILRPNNASSNHIFVSGKYAYVGGGIGLAVVNISSSTAPTTTGFNSDRSDLIDVKVVGKYVYATPSDGTLHVYDIGGADISAANIGNISTNYLTVWENVDIGNNLYVRNGLNVGVGGIMSNGPVSIYQDTTTTQPALSVSNGTILTDRPTPSWVATTATSTQSDSTGVYVSGKYAYVSDSVGNGLTINDISDPLNPIAIGRTSSTMLEGASDVAVVGKYAYVPTFRSNGLAVVDISNPYAPTTTGFTSSSALNRANEIYVVGKYAYVAAYSSPGYLTIVDISNPYAPTTTGFTSNNIDVATDVFVSGKYAYITSQQNNTLAIFDVTNPSAPSLVGTTVSTSLNNAKIYVSGKYLYAISEHKNLFSIIDISNPAAPTTTGFVSSSLLQEGSRVVVAGKYAYVTAAANFGITVLDISDPNSPQIISTSINNFAKYGQPGPMFLAGKYLYTADQYGSRFTITDIKGVDTQAANIGSVATNLLTVWENADIGNNLYVRNGLNVGLGGVFTDGGLNAAGTSTFATASSTSVGIGTNAPQAKLHVAGGTLLVDSPVNASLVGSTPIQSAGSLFVSGKYAYVTGLSNMVIVDISNPALPIRVSTTTGLTGANAIYVAGKYAYVTNNTLNNMAIVDVSDPGKPKIVGTVSGLNSPNAIYVSGKYAYITNSAITGFLSIVDISNPAAPTTTATSSVNLPTSVYVSGKYAYVNSNGASSISIIDVSSPYEPVRTGFVSTGNNPNAVYVSGRFAYVVGQGTDTLKVIDVTSSTAPVVVGTKDDMGVPRSIHVSGKYAYISNTGSSTVSIVNISSSTRPEIVGRIPVAVTKLTVVGKYLYGVSGNSLVIIDINGADISAASIGNIATNDLTVWENVDIGNNLYVRNGLNVGGGGIFSNGPVSIASSTTSTAALLTVYGTSTVQNIMPASNLVYDLGASSTRWNNLWVGTINVGTSTWSLAQDYDGSFSIFDRPNATGTKRLGISSTGTISLGTTTISNLIVGNCVGCASVSGTAGTSTWTFNGSNVFLVTSTSNVGIGTSTPQAKLHVSGGSVLIDTPGFTTMTAKFAINNAQAVAIQGKYAYVADYNFGLRVIDITDPRNMKQVGFGATTYPQSEIFIAGKYAYMSGEASGAASILDISDPANPKEIFSESGLSNTVSVYVDGKYMYRAETGAGVGIYDVSNPASPVEIGNLLSTVGSALSVKVVGKYLYVRESINGLYIYDISDPHHAVTSSLSNLMGYEVAVSGPYMYGPYNNFGNAYINVANIASSSAPVEVADVLLKSSIDTTGKIVISGKYAYVGTISGVSVVDISSTTNPYQIKFVSSTHAYDLAVSGNNLYIADGAGGLRVYDLGGIEATGAKIGSLTSNDLTVWEDAKIGNNLYVKNSLTVGLGGIVSDGEVLVRGDASSTQPILHVSNGSLLIDNPINNRIVGMTSSTAMNTARGVAVNGKYAYVGGAFDSTISIIDISNPERPTTTGWIDYSLGSQSPNPGQVSSLQIAGKYLYLTAPYSNALTIIDVSNAKYPTTTGFVEDTRLGQPWDAKVVGKYAYTVGYSNNTFTVIDVSNPMSPFIVATTTDNVNLTGSVKLYVSGKYAYVASNLNGRLTIVDISNPSQPAVVGVTADLGNGPEDVYVSGRYAYVALDGGFAVVDIANPAAPTVKSSIADVAFAWSRDIVVSGKYAYVASMMNDYINVVDISSSTNPIVISNVYMGPSSPNGVAISGKYAYVSAETHNGLKIVDIGGADISNANIGSTATGDLTVWEDAKIGNNLYVTNGLTVGTGGIKSEGVISTQNLQISNGLLEVGAPANPTIVGFTSSTKLVNAGGVYVSGRKAYVAGYSTNGYGYVAILDVTNPAAPTTTGYVSSTNLYGATTIAVAGKYAYTTGLIANRFGIFDISNPQAPTTTAIMSDSRLDEPSGVAISGKYAYISNRNSGSLMVVDISNPRAPTTTGFTTSPYLGGAQEVYVSGRYAYIPSANKNGLAILDISNPRAPTTTGFTSSTDMRNAQSVYVSGKFAYVTAYDEGLSIVDISSSSAPTTTGVINTVSTVGGAAIQVAGKYAYIANFYYNILDVYDISSSTKPVSVGYVQDTKKLNGAESLYVSGRYAYVVSENDNGGGLTIIDIKGAELSSANIGNMSSNDLTIYENVDIGNNLYVRNSLNVGVGGIYTNGELSVFSTSTLFGNVFIGTTTPFANAKLVVDAGGGTNYGIAVNGYVRSSGTFVSSTALDLAERYPIDPSCEAAGNCPTAGDVICQVENTSTIVIEKCSVPYSPLALGIVSTDPGVVLEGGFGIDNARNVALAGRVPVRVSTANGNIKPGDLLAPSSIPGIAIKATEPGVTVGKALEAYSDNSVNGFVIAYVQLGWNNTLNTAVNGSATSTTTTVSFSMFNGIIEAFKQFGIIIEQGIIRVTNFFANKVTTDELCVGNTCVNEAQLIELLNKNNVENLTSPVPNTSTTPPNTNPPVETVVPSSTPSTTEPIITTTTSTPPTEPTPAPSSTPTEVTGTTSAAPGAAVVTEPVPAADPPASPPPADPAPIVVDPAPVTP